MKRQKNNNRVIKIVVPVIICLVAALVVAGYFLFRGNNISYEGNRHYSDEEMNNYIFGTDTPNAVVYNIFGKKNKQIPFIQKYEVEDYPGYAGSIRRGHARFEGRYPFLLYVAGRRLFLSDHR